MPDYVGRLSAEPTHLAEKLSVFNVNCKIHFYVRGLKEYFPVLGTKVVVLQCAI
jgi:hypothetical protein